jgi:hypothetical protein
MTACDARQQLAAATEQHLRDALAARDASHDWSHIERVRTLALRLGQQEGLGADSMFEVRRAALCSMRRVRCCVAARRMDSRWAHSHHVHAHSISGQCLMPAAQRAACCVRVPDQRCCARAGGDRGAAARH